VSLWKSSQSGRKPVTVTNTVAPPDVVSAELDAAQRSAVLDLTDRVHAALEEIDGLMAAEHAKGRDGRNVALFNALLDVRGKLAPGSTVLPIRRRTPYIPGRAS